MLRPTAAPPAEPQSIRSVALARLAETRLKQGWTGGLAVAAALFPGSRALKTHKEGGPSDSSGPTTALRICPRPPEFLSSLTTHATELPSKIESFLPYECFHRSSNYGAITPTAPVRRRRASCVSGRGMGQEKKAKVSRCKQMQKTRLRSASGWPRSARRRGAGTAQSLRNGTYLVCHGAPLSPGQQGALV